MNVYTTRQMFDGKETYEERLNFLANKIFNTFEDLHCDYRIGIPDIEEGLRLWVKYRNHEISKEEAIKRIKGGAK